MKTHIEIGTGLKLDVAALLKTRLLVQANSGGGKSWLLRRLAEQLFGTVPVIILDVEGEFATLREKYGYVLIGKGGEAPADLRSAGLVAHKLLELRASAVCDLYELKPQARHQWVRLFLEALIDAPKELWRPTVIVIDEAHQFCPEGKAGESEASGAVVDLCTRGRKRGFCAVLATQRLGKLRKDAAAELLNVMVGMTFIDIDRERAADCLGVASHDKKTFFDQIKVLENGNFWCLGRALCNERQLVKVGQVFTTHPEAGGGKYAATPPPAPETVRAMLPKLSDLPKAAEDKARTEAELKAEVRDLKAKLRAVPVVEKPVETVKRVEIPVLKDGQLARAEKICERMSELARDLVEAKNELCIAIGKTRAVQAIVSAVKSPVRVTPPTQYRQPVPVSSNGDGEWLPDKCERAILRVLSQFPEGCQMGKIALLAGYRVSGGFRNALSSLRTQGCIVGENGGTMQITEQGMTHGPYDELPSGDERISYWLNHPSLGKCERGILKVLIENPAGLDINALAQQSQYEVSGGFRNSLSALRTAGLIEGGNQTVMRPTELLIQ